MGTYFSTTRPPFHQNVYGGTLGGPILKNRAFFFVAYQGLQNSTAQTQLTPVFSGAQKARVISRQTKRSLSSKPIPFPAGLQGPVGILPCRDTRGKRVFPEWADSCIGLKLDLNQPNKRYVPQSNYTISGINYYNFNAPNTDADNQGIISIDDQFTSKDVLWGSAIFDSDVGANTLPLPSTDSPGTGAKLPGFAANNSSHTENFDASWTHMFNSTTFNELRAGYSRYNYAELEPAASTIAPPSTFGFDIVPQDAAVGTLPS